MEEKQNLELVKALKKENVEQKVNVRHVSVVVKKDAENLCAMLRAMLHGKLRAMLHGKLRGKLHGKLHVIIIYVIS